MEKKKNEKKNQTKTKYGGQRKNENFGRNLIWWTSSKSAKCPPRQNFFPYGKL